MAFLKLQNVYKGDFQINGQTAVYGIPLIYIRNNYLI